MIPSLLFALALFQADPVATGASLADPTAVANAVTPPAAPADGEVPKGAPEDDYDFVAWCHGALSGHMALYGIIKPELKSIERSDEVAGDETNDREQMAAGREYLALYTRALHAAGKAHPKAMTERRLKAEAQGEAIWAPAKAAEPRTRMWSWLLWDLPGRCEIAAKRLQGRSGVFGAALRAEASPAGPPGPQAAPASIDDALSAAPSPTADAPPLRGPQ